MWHATSITQTAYQNYCFLGPPNQAVRRPKVTLGLKIWRITQAIHVLFFFFLQVSSFSCAENSKHHQVISEQFGKELWQQYEQMNLLIGIHL